MFGRKKIIVDDKEYKSLDEIKEGKEEKKERKKKEEEERKRKEREEKDSKKKEKEEKKFMKEIEKEREKLIEKEEEEEKKRKKKPVAVYSVDYIGGHPKYPRGGWTEICLFEEYLMFGHQRVPYKNIKRIGNLTDEHITGKRVFLTGPIIGLLWKKRFLYTVIDYAENETGEEISLITDFHGKIDQAQPKIYEKMVAVRDSKNRQFSEAEEQRRKEAEKQQRKMSEYYTAEEG